LAEQSGLAQDTPIPQAGHTRQISHSDSPAVINTTTETILYARIDGNSHQSHIKEDIGEASVSAWEINLGMYMQEMQAK